MRLMKSIAVLACCMLLSAGAAPAAPSREIKIGIATFETGPASVFGIPAKATAQMIVDEFNKAGGIGGAKITPVFIDEGAGGEQFVAQYRRLVAEQGIHEMLAAISSADCNAIAPVAEELKVLNILWDCGTEKMFEARRYNYVFRTTSYATTEMVASVLYLLKTKPNFKTIAVVNQDYAWGHDSWATFSQALKTLKPDAQVVSELYPKFGAADYSTEITRLLALHPDVVVSTAWGNDLDTFIRQAAQRGLTTSSTLVLPLAESSLERVGSSLPDGVIVGARGDYYFLTAEARKNKRSQDFVNKYHQKTGQYPIYPVYHMIAALDALKATYEKAMRGKKSGSLPTAEELAAAMNGLSYTSFTRPINLREDHQALMSQLLGTTKHAANRSFAVIANVMMYPADLVTPPVGQRSDDWIKTLNPRIIDSPRIQRVGIEP